MLKKIVKYFYRRSCAVVEDMESYWYMGKAVGYEIERDNLAFWTKMARRFGVKAMNKIQRVEFGGYGYEVPDS